MENIYASQGYVLAGIGQRFIALILDAILFWLTVVIGYIIWWLIVIGRGQTPGKQLVGIRCVQMTGEPCGWGLTFVRELLIKGVVISIISGVTFGIVGLLNLLWPFWDGHKQTFHDKIVGTVVVKNR